MGFNHILQLARSRSTWTWGGSLGSWLWK